MIVMETLRLDCYAVPEIPPSQNPLNPCHTRVASSQRSKKLQIAEVRAVQSPATLCGGVCFEHA